MNRTIWPSAPFTSSRTPFSLLELAAIFGARDQAAHVERHQRAVLQRIGHVAIGDAQRQPFGDGGLADAGIADQDGIVLGAAGQDLDRPPDFLVAADHGVELALARRLGQVAGEFLERVIAILRPGRVGGPPAAQIVDRGVQAFRLHARRAQRLARRRGGGQGEGQQQPLDRDEAVARLGRDLFRAVQHAHGVVVEAGCLLRPAAGNGRNLGQRRVGFAQRHARIAARRLDQAGRHALLVLQQCLQQMLRADALMAHPDRDGLRRLEKALGAVSEFFEVHTIPFVKLLTM